MRLIKMLGLAAIAAVAASAFLGAATASADWLCEKNVVHTGECAAADRVAKNSLIAALTLPGKRAILLNGAKIEMECDSLALGKFLGNESVAGAHKPVLGLITKLVFEPCTGTCQKAQGDNLPFFLLAVASLLHALITSDPVGGKEPAATLEGCAGIGAKCLYEIELPALMKVEGDTLVAKEIGLVQSGCLFFPSLAKWDATYLLTLDIPGPPDKHEKPIYLTLLPASLP